MYPLLLITLLSTSLSYAAESKREVEVYDRTQSEQLRQLAAEVEHLNRLSQIVAKHRTQRTQDYKNAFKQEQEKHNFSPTQGLIFYNARQVCSRYNPSLIYHPRGDQLMRFDHDSSLDTCVIFDLPTKTIKTIPHGLWDLTGGAAYSPNGEHIALAERFKAINIFTNNYEKQSTLEHPRVRGGGTIYHLVYSPNNKYLASSCQRMTCVWDYETQKVLHEINPNATPEPTFSPDSKLFVATHYYVEQYRTPLIQFYDTTAWKPITTWKPGIGTFHMSYSSDGTQLATVHPGKTTIHDTRDYTKPLYELKDNETVSCNADSSQWVSINCAKKMVSLWNSKTGTCEQTITLNSPYLSCAFHPTNPDEVAIADGETTQIYRKPKADLELVD